jgi:hypothetical protein
MELSFFNHASPTPPPLRNILMDLRMQLVMTFCVIYSRDPTLTHQLAGYRSLFHAVMKFLFLMEPEISSVDT